MTELPVVDLSSGTVTCPTLAMREVIAGVEVGNDALGDDPGWKRRWPSCLVRNVPPFFPSSLMADHTDLVVLSRWVRSFFPSG